jgi:hypothetical protein
MSKLDQVLTNYAKEADILLEQPPPPPPPVDPMAAPPPGVDPMAPAVPAGEPPAAEGEEQKTKTLTDQGYVTAVMDMLELLSINPEDLEENDLDIFSDKVNPKNALKLHDKLRDLIDRYGSPSA